MYIHVCVHAAASAALVDNVDKHSHLTPGWHSDCVKSALLCCVPFSAVCTGGHLVQIVVIDGAAQCMHCSPGYRALQRYSTRPGAEGQGLLRQTLIHTVNSILRALAHLGVCCDVPSFRDHRFRRLEPMCVTNC